jgi:hypothetical protein
LAAGQLDDECLGGEHTKTRSGDQRDSLAFCIGIHVQHRLHRREFVGQIYVVAPGGHACSGQRRACLAEWADGVHHQRWLFVSDQRG